MANLLEKLRQWLNKGTPDATIALNLPGPNPLSLSATPSASYPIAADSMPNELFLSHSIQDRPFADRLAGILRKHGVPVWYSQTQLLGAQQWQDEIGKALDRCDWFAVILTSASVTSPWVKRELSYALNEPRYEGHIVPILCASCNVKQLSWPLLSFQTVNFMQDHGSGCRDLLRIWGVGYNKNA